MSVHVKGQISFLGENELVEVLKKTSLHFEGGRTDSSTAYDNLPEEYRSRLLKAIVAFEVEVEEIDNVFKLSQNRNRESYNHIIQHLENAGPDAAAVAGEMKKRTTQVFSSEKDA
jgi:transcriptional regulator